MGHVQRAIHIVEAEGRLQADVQILGGEPRILFGGVQLGQHPGNLLRIQEVEALQVFLVVHVRLAAFSRSAASSAPGATD